MYSRASRVAWLCGLLVLTCSTSAREIALEETQQGLLGTESSSNPAVLPAATTRTHEAMYGCAIQPCLNQGTCLDLPESENSKFTCFCRPAYTGEFCEIRLDPCLSNPCEYGTCSSDGFSYRCNCTDTGFTGVNCNEDVNECLNTTICAGNPCFNRPGGFSCVCPMGFEGVSCKEINECKPSPCLNGGTCTDGINEFTCTCLPGFEGANCGFNTDDCKDIPCENGGVCLDGNNDYTCNCTSEWMGKNCTEVYNACSQMPCLNGATCSTDLVQHHYTCTCLPGFTGANCEVNIDDCVGHNCPDYQQCFDRIGNYTCECPRGYTGVRCDSKILPCDNNPCQNNGICEPRGEGYKCICPNAYINITSLLGPKGIFLTGYGGTNCEEDINECDYNDPPICQQGGRCENWPPGGFTCFCKNSPGHLSIGTICEDMGNYCDIRLPGQGCQNGGTCVNLFLGFGCNCAPGFAGRYCEVDINECLSQPCLHNGVCSDRINGYACTCLEGFRGTNCEMNIDDCFSNPCLNGGICQDHINNFTCDCTNTGYLGTTCEVDIDWCLLDRCQHGGTCINHLKDSRCQCLPGYWGVRCEADIAECSPNPCAYNSQCLEFSNTSLYDKGDPHFINFTYDKAAGYRCVCPLGLMGVNCTEDENECLYGPCQHNATCLNIFKDGFTCMCTPGYHGSLCENDINECNLYTPCKNGGVCTDKLADYVCTCPEPLANRMNYGGRNCTTLLTGCMDPIQCQHGDCIPHLYSDAEDIHTFRCDCFPGYAGKYCTESTTVSFNSSGVNYMLIPVAPAYFMLSLRFRTSVPTGVLVLWTFSNTAFVSVELSDGKILMQYKDTSGIQVCTLTTRSPVNNSEYHQLNLKVSQKIQLSLPSDNCTDDACSSPGCQTSFTFRESQPHNGSQIYIGRGSAVPVDDPGMPSGFVGCVEDVVVDGIHFYPGMGSGQYYVGSGCPRVPQCVPDSCSGHGFCEDLWDSYTCHCDSPYYGENCQNA